MNVFLKHSVLAFLLLVYGLFIFSPSIDMPVLENSAGQVTNHEHHCLTEIAKVLFPQNVNPSGATIAVVHIGVIAIDELQKSIITIQELKWRVVQLSTNYLKDAVKIVLQFPPEDIIYPFHTFW